MNNRFYNDLIPGSKCFVFSVKQSQYDLNKTTTCCSDMFQLIIFSCNEERLTFNDVWLSKILYIHDGKKQHKRTI